MFPSSGSRESFDSLSPTTSRTEFNFPRRSSHTAHPLVQRRGSTASSVHSVGGSLDTASGGWGSAVFESGQNAISTLLQPPIVRTGLLPHTSAPASSAHKPPTSRDIPPVALTNIPHVEAAEFKPYLSQVGPLYEHLRRLKESEEDAASVLNRRNSRPEESPDAVDEGHLRPGKRPGARRKGSTASISSLSSIDAPSPVRRGSGFNSRKSIAHGPPPLSTIPNVYFEEDFHLENPRTFDVVSERSEVVRPVPGTMDDKEANGNAAAPRKALATNAILQEKLSWYMDTIEMHLIQSISTASTTFFTALGALRELHSEAAESVDRIKALREELEALDQEVASTGLNIVQQRRRRENLQQLHDAVLQLREIVNSVAACESLVESGEIEQALDSIDSLEMLIAGEPGSSHDGPRGMQLRDLRGAVALQGVSSDMDTLRLRIGMAYETKFLNILMGDIRRHTEEVVFPEVLMRWTSASMRVRGGHGREPSAFPSYMASVDGLRSELFPVLNGLRRAKHLARATTAFREAVLRHIRNVIRKPLPSSNDDDNESMMSSSTMTGGKKLSQQEKSSILARNLRTLEPQDAEELLVKVYIGVTETLRRLTIQAKLLIDVASSIGDDPSLPAGLKSPPLKSPPFSPTRHSTIPQPSMEALEAQEEIHKTLDLTNLLGQAVDVAQDKIVKLLRVRSDQSSHLGLVWFLRYFALNLHFANECESISGRSCSSLKTVVNGQIKEFVQHHGDKEKQQLAQEMESDRWDAKDFGESDQRLLGEILESSTKDAPSWSEGTMIWLPFSDSDEGANGQNDSTQSNGSAKGKIRSAVIDGESYSLPNSAVLCMHGMAHFLHLIVGISSITTDVSASLISYLQLFNSRCTQLILGAGATRSAGLKNITTKHLALASQALGFIAALIPHVREFVRRHCGSGSNVSSVMGEFDKVRRLYQEHQNSIYDKLVEIMSGRALVGAKKMKAIEWDSGKDSVHDYMETLAKETTTLHRNLTKHLPESTVRLIMLPVFRSYKDTFGTALRAVEPQTEAGRDSMLRDIDHFETRLGNLDGFEDAGEYLRNIAKSKEVASPEPPPAAPAADQPEEKKASEAEEQPEAEKQPEPAKESNGDTKPKHSAELAAQIG
ncbi:Vps54-domain-containing protein [Coniochaeta ligniaria NRRL 30616]|uniref:Vacuolar protein sorting-associated protein 54 n=1 Tax=Coniochaeta ligniaria NRRL 30616 TaxID=1408157 RepID=A0A1J7JLW0_9PEZI|nr:Vps54-domain-containing protein [Coniochaeta ligniaria NRRL 30616]